MSAGRNPYFEAIPDGARIGRVAEGGARHEATTATDHREWLFKDRDGDDGRILAGYGFVGIDLQAIGEGFELQGASHVLDPDATEKMACRLLAAATIARKLKRP